MVVSHVSTFSLQLHKRVAVIGGGPSGLSAAYYLQLMGHQCTVFEKRKHLGGMLRYGIPSYRLPRQRLQEDIDCILSTGVEVQGALEEGAEMLDLHAPLSIEVDGEGRVKGLWTEPKQIGLIHDRRADVISSGSEPELVPCDVVVVAIGQSIETQYFQEEGIPIKRGVIAAEEWTAVDHAPGVFAGGDCVTGPKTAIRAIAAGKVAAANIDNFLGFNHHITVDVEIPEVSLRDHKYCGRVNLSERSAADRKQDFELMEEPMSERAAQQEASRCLRCDHFGCGNFKGGRLREW